MSPLPPHCYQIDINNIRIIIVIFYHESIEQLLIVECRDTTTIVYYLYIFSKFPLCYIIG